MIREIATRLFQERGYHATTMDDISTAAGLNKATVYHYYPSKHQLLFDIYSSGIDAILDRFSAHDESMPADEAIVRIIHDVISAMAEDQSRAAVYYQERPFVGQWFSSEGYAELQAREKAYLAHAQGVIERGVKEGAFKNVDARATALTLLNAASHTYSWYRPARGPSAAEIADLVSALFLCGLVR